jgi:hypothetical protein
MLACSIANCTSLRVGVAVNIIFILVGLAVLLLVRIAHLQREEIGQSVKAEARGQLSNAGYALHLAAGCAFFGALTLTELVLVEHVAFALTWLLALVVLLLAEFVLAKIRGPSKEFSFARGMSILMAIVFICWVCSGARWPG